ncbi:VOC family protein [Corynebacterium pyruviciproducens]|uniref:PhnB-like domain-containing protein n=1 Tax=Corynebacterium pyruviciproducens ATCC BAA-1742 TaxID=1125779 RepID=S2Z6N3_9CORY|nr:VOC family protein [Corynebacterium pyruviciproducens]EPD69900.1 hypothetical protein HMPREF1219_00845 [Corynebacterium pyruviciproducens ATCC BAA-1742]MDK6566213.1 VOC family protein [Corynebacterium pyruviciproducens]MDK7214396.1 VOC family protein [Corynebacterium pyruviciproducens]
MSFIVPVMRFDDELDEAIDFYDRAFYNARVEKVYHYPSDPDTCGLLHEHPEVAGQTMGAKLTIGNSILYFINAPVPVDTDESVSFIANFQGIDDPQMYHRAEETWEKLCDGGEVLVDFESFPGGRSAGIVRDRYGVTWEIMVTISDGKKRQFLVPSIAFGGQYQNQASEAVDFYTEVFPEHIVDETLCYPEDDGLVTKKSLLFCAVQVLGQCFVFQDAGVPTESSPRRSTVFAIFCKDQEEIDTLWDQLAANEEPSGFPGLCTDKYGINWMVVPDHMASKAEDGPTMEKLWSMEKIELADL